MTASYTSPTTPGLSVNFGQYLVELVCLNMEPNLGPRFWKDPKYWGKKFGREMHGFSKFSKMYQEDIETPLRQQAIINAVRRVRNQSLLVNNTLERLDRAVQKEYSQLVAQREQMIAQSPVGPDVDPTEFASRNAKIVGAPTTNRLEKVRRIEQRGQEEGEAKVEGAGVGREQ